MTCAIPLHCGRARKRPRSELGLNHLGSVAAIEALPFLRDTFAQFDEWPEERVGQSFPE